MRQKIKALLEIIGIVILFLIFAYLVQENLSFFERFLGKNFWGFLIYSIIEIISIVIAPLTSIPLVPIVSNLWGWQLAAVISVFSWTLGAIIAFVLARKYGVKIVQKLISLESIYNLEKKIPQEHLFFSVLFLRMVIPVDILSYALGLFSRIKFWPYAIATFIGIIPGVVLFAYVGAIPFIYQVITILIVGIIIISGLIVKCKVKSC